MKQSWFSSCGSRALVVLLFVCSSSCAWLGDRTNEYKKAEEGRPLVIPSELNGDKPRERYPIPQISASKVPDGEFELPLPPDATSSLTDEPYTVKTFDGDSWLELVMPPSKAWPLVDTFWLEYGLQTHTERVADGYFGTEELVEGVSHEQFIKDLESTSHAPVVIDGMSFQARLSQGIRRNTSEIQVRAFMPKTPIENRMDWQVKSVTPKLERALLELIGESITGEGSGSRYSLNAVNIGDQSRIRIIEDEAGIAVLEINLGFKRAWTEVVEALEASPIIVSGKEQQAGIIYVSYLDEEDIDSWYTTESSLQEQKAERNIEIRFYPEGPDVIRVRAKLLNDALEPESERALIELLYEYIS